MPAQDSGSCWKHRPEQSLLLGLPSFHHSRGTRSPGPNVG